MGRPIKSKFFGNRLFPYDNEQTGGASGVGGEGVLTVTVGTSTNAPVSTLTVTMSFSAPDVAGGITATGTPVKTGNTVTSVVITNTGSGYLTVPNITFTGTNMTTTGTAVAVLSSDRQNAISIISFISTGSSAVTNGDIIKQEGSRRYLVQNSQGRGICVLSTGTLSAGQMHIIASDFGGATYYVTKLTARKARVAPRTSTSTAYYSGAVRVAPWTIGAASGTTTGTAIIALNATI
jgi:hypothetical protein